jgi:hypothetical protein
VEGFSGGVGAKFVGVGSCLCPLNARLCGNAGDCVDVVLVSWSLP